MEKVTGNHSELEWREIVPLDLSYLDLLIMVGQIILALRHPKNRGASSHQARKLAEDMAKRLTDRFDDEIPGHVKDEWRKEGIL